MDDEDGMEDFKISNWDIENEFNINRRGKRQSKNQATYGMFILFVLDSGIILAVFRNMGRR